MTEIIYPRGPWKSIDQVEYATLEWVDWVNHRRLLGPIGNIPAEFEQAYYDQLEESAVAARLIRTRLRDSEAVHPNCNQLNFRDS